MYRKSLLVILTALLAAWGCSSNQTPVELKSFPLDSADGVIAQTGITFDPAVSVDGKGSLRIEANEAVTVPLFEISDVTVEEARIFYQAKVKTERVIGQVYLEMRCRIPGLGESFSRGQATLLSGTNDWTSQETPFILQKGEAPDLIKLNLVINGQGVVWIDDIKLVKGALR